MHEKPGILLTGASGTVGYAVLKQLFQLRHKYNITVFDLETRKSRAIFSRYKNEIEIVYGDIYDNDDIIKVCRQKDVVIHLAAIIPPLADAKPELARKVNIIGTENLIRNLENLSPCAFFLYSSSISVYGNRVENPMIKVSDPLSPSEGDEYAKTKIAAEQIIRNSKLDWSIFRLTAIMESHKVTKLMFHMPLATCLEIATSEDTARAFILAIENRPRLSKKIFNLGGGEKCRTTYKEFLTRSFEISGLGKLDFPPKAFAEKNFHCGFYADGDDLENILHFRQDSLDRYFEKTEKSISFCEKQLTKIFQKQIKKNLLKESEPYKAFISKDKQGIKHYFQVKPVPNAF